VAGGDGLAVRLIARPIPPVVYNRFCVFDAAECSQMAPVVLHFGAVAGIGVSDVITQIRGRSTILS
jgi:hypothetical protein